MDNPKKHLKELEEIALEYRPNGCKLCDKASKPKYEAVLYAIEVLENGKKR